MKELIQFSDDIFYIYELIKTISTASQLNLNSSLFSAKIIQDIQFIHSTLNELQNALKASPPSRLAISNLRSLLKARNSFKTTLSSINTSTPFIQDMLKNTSDANKSIFTFLKQSSKEQDRQIDQIISMLNELDKTDDPSIFISQEEMNLLLNEE